MQQQHLSACFTLEKVKLIIELSQARKHPGNDRKRDQGTDPW
jgi:hypothetical protein